MKGRKGAVALTPVVTEVREAANVLESLRIESWKLDTQLPEKGVLRVARGECEEKPRYFTKSCAAAAPTPIGNKIYSGYRVYTFQRGAKQGVDEAEK